MSIENGTRVLVKSALQMGMTRSNYLFNGRAGQHLFVVEPALNNPGCYVLCPEDELDGENDKYRPFNEKRPYHVTMPECCFILDPVTQKEKKMRKKSTPEEKVRKHLKTLAPDFDYRLLLRQVYKMGVTDIETLSNLLDAEFI